MSETPRSRSVAVLDLGSTAVRLLVAEVGADRTIRILEEASRGVLLGKDTFTHGRITAATLDAALRALEGFRKIMQDYAVERWRAVATSAVREAANRDTFVDRVKMRTGIDVEVIDGSEENRLSYMAVQEVLGEHEALTHGNTVLAEVGGGSTDVSFLRAEGPVFSGTYALGSIRMQQNLASWHGSHEEKLRLLERHILNVVDDIRREIPLKEAVHFIALGGDVRFAASQILSDHDAPGSLRVIPRDAFLAFCEAVAGLDTESLVETYRLPQAEAETLVPALLASRRLLGETRASEVLVPEASLRAGLLLDLALSEEGHGIEDYSRQVLASASVLGLKYRYDEAHARNVAHLAVRLFDELQAEHGLPRRERLLLEVAALLHDVGMYVGIRGHHKHSLYILSVSDIFGLSREDMAIIANVARYHRRSTPQKSHLPYMALDRDSRLNVSKLSAILRIANALDADHLQKIRELRILKGRDAFSLEVEGSGDLTLERLAMTALSSMFTEVFGRKLLFLEAGART